MSRQSRSQRQRNDGLRIPEIRNFQFGVGPDVPRYWHPGPRSVTLQFNNLSLFFPAGERFFVHTVKSYRHRIADPLLHAQVKAFCAQEGIHSREHMRYNDMLRTQGYPVEPMERRVERILSLVRLLPRRTQLAVTVCLEHFTALMAELILKPDSTALEGANPAMAALWLWHAAEENEHKAVAFDVFTSVGGTHAERSVVMLGTTAVFLFKVVEQQLRMMHADGLLLNVGEWRALVRFLFRPDGVQTLWRPYLAFFKAKFHPWKHDNSALLERWKSNAAVSPEYRRVVSA